MSLLAWLFRLSALTKFISDSILVGFKVGAGLTIAMTQLTKIRAIASHKAAPSIGIATPMI
jgi:SulP family sulfate permease